MERCSKKMVGLLSRIAVRNRPAASWALDGMASCQPMECSHFTSLAWLCQGSPTLKKPPGIRTTIGAAKRLAVRQRIVPVSFNCSSAGSAYLRNWISGTGINPAAAMPTARPIMPSSDRLVSNTRPLPWVSCKPSVAAWTPPLGPTSSPNTTSFGLLASSVSSVRRMAVSILIRSFSVCTRFVPVGN